MAKIGLELHNYHAAFTACIACLKINNQYKEALNFYRDLLDNQDLVLLSKIIRPFQALGYVTSVESLKHGQATNIQRKFIKYQQKFINLLHMIDRTPLDNSIVNIYGDLVKCKSCNIPKKKQFTLSLKNNFTKTYI